MTIPALKTRDETRLEIDAVARQLIAEGTSPALYATFRDQGYPLPEIRWRPAPEALPHASLRSFLLECRAMAGGSQRLRNRDFDIQRLNYLEDWLMLLDVEDDGFVFRYRYYGAEVANLHQRNLSGKTSDAFGGRISYFFNSIYRAAWLKAEAIYTEHSPPRHIFATLWRRAVVPLFSDDKQQVVAFAVMNIPDNVLRPGLDVIPDPVIVADDRMHVRFANRAARECFAKELSFEAEPDLLDFAGIELKLSDTPEELARKSAMRDMKTLSVGSGLLQDFFVTVSGAYLGKDAFYVVTIRPAIA